MILTRKHLHFIAMICMGIALNSCNKIGTKRCPAYSGLNLYRWFPYNTVNKTLIFKTSTGEADTVIITSVNESPSKSNFSLNLDNGPYCEASVLIKAIPNTEQGSRKALEISSNQVYAKVPADDNFGITYRGMKVYAMLNDTEFELRSFSGIMSISSISTLMFNGKLYENAVQVEYINHEKMGNAEIDELYIAKGVGIVGYRTYPDLKEYWLQ